MVTKVFIFSSVSHLAQPLCIMCVQYHGGCSVPWGYHDTCGDILSTVEDVQYRGRYLKYRGGVQYHGTHDSFTVLNTPMILHTRHTGCQHNVRIQTLNPISWSIPIPYFYYFPYLDSSC